MAFINTSPRSKKFIKDFGIYTVGAIGTRIITFLMVSLYTYFIDDPADYGYYDLCLSVCMLLLPLSTLQLREGAFRFLLNNDDPQLKQSVVTSIGKMLAWNLAILLFACLVLSLTTDIQLFWYSVLLLLSMTIHEVMAQMCRGLGSNKVYVVSSLINATGIGLFSVVFVAWLDMGITGVFLANILSRVITVLFIEFKMHVSRYVNGALLRQQTTREILRYCLPMIPIALCWSFTVNSGRFFIKYFIDLEANGIYAVSIRFTMVLQTISIIFYQTWQETSIAQFHSKDRDHLFTKIFYDFFYVLVFLLIGFVFLVKLNFSWLVDDNYRDSLQYIYPLSVAAILNALSAAYFELGYQCSKETKRALPGIVLIFVVNIALGLVLTPAYGIWGIVLTSLLSYLILDIYRFFDTRRYFKIGFSWSLLMPLAMLVLSAVPFYYSTSAWQDLAYMALAVTILLLFIPEDFKNKIRDALHALTKRNAEA